jgi:L-arabinonolactonase
VAAVKLLVDARARLGECVLWCELTGALYWTDIEAATLHRLTLAGGARRAWTLPERVGCFALTRHPTTLLLGMASRIALFDLERERLTPGARVEADRPTTRINDGHCDAQGRLVFGMFDEAPEPAAIGGWYRVGAGLEIEPLPLPPAAAGNSVAFSPDGATMYFCDSPTREIRCCAYGADGRLGTPRRFVKLSGASGIPDGSTVDAAGGLWSAQWDGGCVVRYAADGRESARLELPVTRPTSVAFGGPQLGRLFVSSARTGLADDALARQPAAGGVFEAVPAWRGLPEHRFAFDG